MSHEQATIPWEKIGIDLFQWDNKNYLVTVDYYSNFIEIDQLESNTRTSTVIKKLKSHFARYGSPCQVVSDNAAIFTADQFSDWEHMKISPENSHANGKAESEVKSAKRFLRKAQEAGTDQYLALLDLRNTPTQGEGNSPAQRLMNHCTRTLLLTTANLL